MTTTLRPTPSVIATHCPCCCGKLTLLDFISMRDKGCCRACVDIPYTYPWDHGLPVRLRQRALAIRCYLSDAERCPPHVLLWVKKYTKLYLLLTTLYNERNVPARRKHAAELVRYFEENHRAWAVAVRLLGDET